MLFNIRRSGFKPRKGYLQQLSAPTDKLRVCFELETTNTPRSPQKKFQHHSETQWARQRTLPARIRLQIKRKTSSSSLATTGNRSIVGKRSPVTQLLERQLRSLRSFILSPPQSLQPILRVLQAVDGSYHWRSCP